MEDPKPYGKTEARCGIIQSQIWKISSEDLKGGKPSGPSLLNFPILVLSTDVVLIVVDVVWFLQAQFYDEPEL